MLAIVWAVKHFRPYLYGRNFTIITDHRPLTWLFNVKDPGSRLIRWRLKLEEYDYNIVYKSGTSNANADCLSRIKPEDLIEEKKVFLVADQKESYDDFIKFHYSNLTPNVYNLIETETSILEQKDHIAHTISSDLEMSEDLPLEIKDLIDNYDVLKSRSNEIYDTLKSKSTKIDFNIYHMIVKRNFWDNYSYRDLFYAIQNLKIELVQNNKNSICFPKFTNQTANLLPNKVKEIILFVFRNTNIKITICNNRITNPPHDEIPSILKENHDNPVSGHSGYHRTLNRIKFRYKWKNMKHDIKHYIRNCESCQKNKIERKTRKHPMEITSTSTLPFERIALDIVGPLPLTENGNRFILTLQDDLTKYSLGFPCKNHEARTIADKLVNHFICKFGIPMQILTDQGKDFTSTLLKEVARLFRIKQIQTSAYRPQSNGALERSHATLADYLKHYILTKQTDWDEWIHIAMFSYNTSVHAATKYTPHELVFGNKPELPSSIARNPEFKYSYDSYIAQLKLKLNKCHQIARENVIKSKEKSKKYYDRSASDIVFDLGDQVLLSNEGSKPHISKKFAAKYTGPYEIVQQNSPTNFTIKLKNKDQKVHVNRLKPYQSSPVAGGSRP